MGNPRVCTVIPVPIPGKNPYPHPRRIYTRVAHTNYIESSYYKDAKCNKSPIRNDANAR